MWLLFWSERDGIRTVYRKRSDGTGDEERLVDGEQGRPVAVSPDGQWFTTNHRDDIWMVPIRGGEPKLLIQTPFVEGGANFSPDGQWIVYQGFETGTSTHYIRRADGTGPRITVSTTGANAHWSPDGRELYRRRAERDRMTAPTSIPTARSVRARRLFDFPYHFDWAIAPTAGSWWSPRRGADACCSSRAGSTSCVRCSRACVIRIFRCRLEMETKNVSDDRRLASPPACSRRAWIVLAIAPRALHAPPIRSAAAPTAVAAVSAAPVGSASRRRSRCRCTGAPPRTCVEGRDRRPRPLVAGGVERPRLPHHRDRG
jgi:hypothetical protein